MIWPNAYTANEIEKTKREISELNIKLNYLPPIDWLCIDMAVKHECIISEYIDTVIVIQEGITEYDLVNYADFNK